MFIELYGANAMPLFVTILVVRMQPSITPLAEASSLVVMLIVRHRLIMVLDIKLYYL